MEIFLHFPGEPPGNLAHNLAQEMIATGLNEPVWKKRDHLGKVNPNGKIKIPAHGCELFRRIRCAVVFKTQVGLEINVVKIS